MILIKLEEIQREKVNKEIKVKIGTKKKRSWIRKRQSYKNLEKTQLEVE